MLDPIKSRRRYFFTLVAYEFSFFSFLSCCLSCVCFWHLFWQFSLGEKRPVSMGNQHKHEILSNLSRSWMQQGNPSSSSFFCKIRISVWWVFTYVLCSACCCWTSQGISRSKLCFCTGEIACYSTFDGEKMRKLLLHHFFSTCSQSVCQSESKLDHLDVTKYTQFTSFDETSCYLDF